MQCVLYKGLGCLHIMMKGGFTFSDSRYFRIIIGGFADINDMHEIRMNMSEVDFIDSSALGLLMVAHDCATRLRRTLVFVEPKGQVLSALTEAARFTPLRISV